MILGNLAAFRSYITMATFSSERTAFISIAAGFQCLGMTLGPALQATLSPLQSSEPSIDTYISLDMFTAAGYLIKSIYELFDTTKIQFIT